VTLRATVPNSDHRFWPGRFVNIRLVLNTIHSAVLVPASAPQMAANGSFVYVVKPDSTADQRQVTLGQRQGDLIVVETGVQAGERVVINGQLGVTPGGKVLVEQPKEGNGIRLAGRSNESLGTIHPAPRDDCGADSLGDPVWCPELFSAAG
jgi:multidrug efflux system membrane fusion protein